MFAPLTVGGWPASVSRAAPTSALMALINRQPPTVEPGATGVLSPFTWTMASPGGAPVSRVSSAKSWSFLPAACFEALASERRRLDDGHHLGAPALEAFGDFDGHEVAAARGDDQGGVGGARAKLRRIRSARPETFSRNIACRWPVGADHEVVELSDNSTIGLNPGN